MPRPTTLRIAQAIRRFQASLPIDVADSLAIEASRQGRPMNEIVIDSITEYVKIHSDDPVSPVITHNGHTEKDIMDMSDDELRIKAEQMHMTFEDIVAMRDEAREQQL